jgi:hypothetical protein
MAEIDIKFPRPGSVSREAREGKSERIRRGREGVISGPSGLWGCRGKWRTGTVSLWKGRDGG